jgi:histidinol-phosphate phosphatase family protein
MTIPTDLLSGNAQGQGAAWPRRLPSTLTSEKRPAVFLDRDGTLIVEKNYLSSPDGVTLLVGVLEGLRALQELRLPLVVVSNQSGIGRGYFSLKEAEAVNARIARELTGHGICISGWCMCPHAPDAGCNCRKPLPGLIEQASRDLDLEPKHSFVIGDRQVDLDLARAVGAEPLLVPAVAEGGVVIQGRDEHPGSDADRSDVRGAVCA